MPEKIDGGLHRIQPLAAVRSLTTVQTLASALSLALVWSMILSSQPAVVAAQTASDSLPEIHVVTDDTGSRLQVDGEDFMVFGMNWG